MKILLNENNLIEGIAYVGSFENAIDFDGDLPVNFEENFQKRVDKHSVLWYTYIVPRGNRQELKGSTTHDAQGNRRQDREHL